MLILLPPSERKATRNGGRGRPARYDTLSFPELEPTRRRVRESLAQVSAQPEPWTLLGLPPGLAEAVEHNTRLDSAPALPAEELYTGVLYDALGLADLPPAALRRARSSVVITSALFGALRLRDRVPPYRLSANTALPGLPTLAQLWRPALDQALTEAAGAGLLVDCRSGGYMAMWTPPAALRSKWVHVQVPGASHMAKLTRGEVARAIAVAPGAAPRTPKALATAMTTAFEGTHEVALHEPSSASKPWVLTVRPVG